MRTNHAWKHAPKGNRCFKSWLNMFALNWGISWYEPWSTKLRVEVLSLTSLIPNAPNLPLADKRSVIPCFCHLYIAPETHLFSAHKIRKEKRKHPLIEFVVFILVKILRETKKFLNARKCRWRGLKFSNHLVSRNTRWKVFSIDLLLSWISFSSRRKFTFKHVQCPLKLKM